MQDANEQIKNASLSLPKFNELMSQVANGRFYTVNIELTNNYSGGGFKIEFKGYIHGFGLQTSASINEILYNFKKLKTNS